MKTLEKTTKAIAAYLISDRYRAAVTAALCSRGKNKGRLLARCPDHGTDAAAAWIALMLEANPYKVGFGVSTRITEETEVLFQCVSLVGKAIDCRLLDKDRETLEALGAY